ncbi:MAG: Hsp20/alpha crystallin family protein [Candidatus Cloacimonetes bacterium]|nr:Hsp20/alpha crystallin family protein [Candidatus Cloacimonadota bacterium]
MPDKIYSNLNGIRREMLKILGEVSSLTKSPLAIEDAIDDFWHPKCDVYQTETQWVVLVELAGVNKDEINISASSEYLRVSGTRVLHSEDCQTTYYSMEIDTGRFDRRIFFPDLNLDKEHPKVQYVNGILRIAFTIQAMVERIIPID